MTWAHHQRNNLSIESARKKDISVYADIVARLSCVDGGVVLNKNLDLIGFGAQAIADLTNIAPPKMRFVTCDDQIDTGKSSMTTGCATGPVTDSVSF